MTTLLSRTYWNYIWQPLIIFAFLAIILNVFLFTEHVSDIAWAVGTGSLASSAYLVFAKPSTVSARPLCLIVSYVLAITCGLVTHYLGDLLLLTHDQLFWMSFLAAFSATITLLFMVWMNVEHPPAIGMALVCVIDLRDYHTLIIVLGAVTVLVILKLALSRWLRDLY
ncbi:MAG: hypothetical protein A3E82_07075 [Gammaproteobacteria bacterium RIFCSPHIGHO2_12_FULL_38_11]|nr:MAG: hypothetical protein A3E82_07075 [Gammaproteobacteria bacterium RIFCSPHIGHO2_12_FULL_38_11]